MSGLHLFELDEVCERRFDRKRENFIVDHGLENRPAIVWQCTPAERLLMDAVQEPIAAVLETGASQRSGCRDGWWYGFSAGRRVSRVFDGFASASPDNAIDHHGWVTQLHRDGHLIAGLWTFPEGSEGQGYTGPLVAAFHVDAFVDFGSLSTRVFEAAEYAGAVLLTATMCLADQLRFANVHGPVSATRLRRNQLRWPVTVVSTPNGIPDECLNMARQFMSAFGLGLPRR